MKKKIYYRTVLTGLVVSLAMGQAFADGGGDDGPDPVAHKITFEGPKYSTCYATKDTVINRHVNIKIYYQNQLECDLTTYAGQGPVNWTCKSMVHDAGHYHKYVWKVEKAYTSGGGWVTVGSFTQQGDPKSLYLDQGCGLKVTTH